MLHDSELVFGTNETIATDGYSANAVDLGISGRNLSAGTDLYVIVKLTDPESATGDETYAAQIRTSDSVSSGDLSGTVTTLETLTFSRTGALQYKDYRLPKGMKRYVQVYYDVGGTTPTGKWTSYISDTTPDRGTDITSYKVQGRAGKPALL